MKPNFALSLSFDGIRLLLRAAGGWRLVGDVPVNSPDLARDLAELRRTAVDLRPGRVRSKIIIPDDQIKYLTVDTGDVDREARLQAVRAALEGATPYPVDALAFDICEDGPRTHAAAVARETLTEAEAFASEHRFHPVSFVAAPEDQAFMGEPWFGPTAHSANILGPEQEVEPDGVRVVVIGGLEDEDSDVEVAPDRPASDDTEAAVADAEPEVEPEQDAPTGAETERAEDTAPPGFEQSGQDGSAPETSEPVPAETSAPTTPPSADTVGDAPDEDVAGDPQLDDANSDDPDEEIPLVAFTRARRDPAPDRVGPEGGAPDGDADDARPAAPKPAPARAITLDFEPDERTAPPLGFASRRRTDPVKATALGGVTRKAPPAGAAPPVAAPEPTQPPMPRPDVAADSLRPTAPPVEDAPPAPAPDRPGGFLSRRKAPRAAAVTAAPGPLRTATPDPDAEARRMTVFGARGGAVGGKPRYLGLVLTAILLIFLAAVAAWASVFLDDRLASLFPSRDRTLASTLPDDADGALAADVGVTTSPDPEEEADEGVAVAALNTSLTDGLTEEDAAVLDALRDPLPDPQPPEELDAAALEARYAVTGIWPRAPVTPDAPDLVPLEDLYVTGIDPVSPVLDAVALPRADDYLTDAALPNVSNPAAPGTDFSRDDAGRIIPTPEGALDPDGFTVFLGKPPVVPPPAPGRSDDGTTPEATDPAQDALAGLRPRARPSDLVEQSERAALGGLSRSELAEYRPRLRPLAPQETAVPDPDPTPQAEAEEPGADPAPVVALPTAPMLRPAGRPRNFDRIVARTERQQQRAAPEPTRTAAVAPRTVTPAIPSTASVAREATVKNAINLRRVNLIGVYGTPSNRRALVRLANGRYQKVEVGDRFDGGRVSAIGDSELRYQKGGRQVVLKMPSG